MADSKKKFSIRWPKSENHRLQSASGIIVESNLQRQVVVHFFNEIRELDTEVDYGEDGSRQGEPQEIVYVRELMDTILVSENTALQLRDALNTLFPVGEDSSIN